MKFFFDPTYKLNRIEEFLNQEILTVQEYEDLHHHSKILVFTRIVDIYLESISTPSDKSVFISLIKRKAAPEEIHSFLSAKVSHISFKSVFKKVEEEVLLVLSSD